MASSKFTETERLKIGEEICNHKYTKYTAAALYGISPYTAREYFRMYKAYLMLKKGEADESRGAMECGSLNE